MKGVVFTEFQELVENQFGFATYDALITSSELASSGVYTAVGTYDYRELMTLVQHLGERLNVTQSDLVFQFGEHLFQSFGRAYPQLLASAGNSLELISHIEGSIHVEVRKLYPDAELPSLEFRQIDERSWEVAYQSTRPLADLCHGLLTACVRHFGDPLDITRQDTSTPPGYSALFLFHSKQ